MGAIFFRIDLGTAGSLSITPRPRGGDWLDDDIGALAARGISVVVSLLGQDEESELGLEGEASACGRRALTFVAAPVPDLGIPADTNGFMDAVHDLVTRLRAGENVAVHCRQSVGRSGMLAVAISVATGVGLEGAIAKVSSARGVQVPETAAQLEWLRLNAAGLSRMGG
jgi:protein-tyrosine phosphatase